MEKNFFTLPSNFWKEKPISIGSIKVHLIWFDSMGAKSSCILVKTPEISVLVDPGVASMQPSYPLSEEEKSKLRECALKCILEASKEADIIFISHYHYDHHTLPEKAEKIYRGKKLWIKNPNFWINYSQWKRSRLFLEQLIGAEKFEKIQISFPPSVLNFLQIDPLDNLSIARKKNYGSYQKRKEELLERGKRELKKLIEKWKEGPCVEEESLKRYKIYLADGKSFQIGSTKVKFSLPLFHGMEYDRLGWVIALVVERKGIKLLYTSDLQGPIIEDYAKWIVKEKPHILIIDGPPTYLFGYMLNFINLKRSRDNLIYILDELSPHLLIYDHHLLRDRHYQERVLEVYEYARKKGKKLLTAAEWYGYKPLILQLAR